MSWVRFDDGYRNHPKIVFAGRSGRELHEAAIFYSAQALTDGKIHVNQLRKIASSEEIEDWEDALARLSTVIPGFDLPSMVDLGDGWYQIHDYLDYQPSKAQVEAARQKKNEARAEAGRAGGRASGAARRLRAASNGEATAQQTACIAEACTKHCASNGEANVLANAMQNRSPVPEPVPVSDSASLIEGPEPPDAPVPAREADPRSALVSELIALGVNATTASDLASRCSSDSIRRQIGWLPGRSGADRAAVLVSAIRGNWAAPERSEISDFRSSEVNDRLGLERRRSELAARKVESDLRERDDEALLLALTPEEDEALRVEAMATAGVPVRTVWSRNPAAPGLRAAKLRILRGRANLLVSGSTAVGVGGHAGERSGTSCRNGSGALP
jgi:hypothetical protein